MIYVSFTKSARAVFHFLKLFLCRYKLTLLYDVWRYFVASNYILFLTNSENLLHNFRRTTIHDLGHLNGESLQMSNTYWHKIIIFQKFCKSQLFLVYINLRQCSYSLFILSVNARLWQIHTRWQWLNREFIKKHSSKIFFFFLINVCMVLQMPTKPLNKHFQCDIQK